MTSRKIDISSTQVGVGRSHFPNELWQNVFEQTHTLDDAISWADAFGIDPNQRDWHHLIARQCPALLRVVPEPSVATLWPGPTGYFRAGAMQSPAIDLDPLLGPLLDRGGPKGAEVEAIYTPLWDAAAFMTRFAPDSPITYELLGHARKAWAARFCDEDDSDASYRCCVMDEVISLAYREGKTEIQLLVGGGAPFPYYWQGLTPVTTLSLFGVDETFDCATACSWPELKIITVEARLAPSVRAWLETQVHARRSDIRVDVLPASIKAPMFRTRWGSAEWHHERSSISIARSETMISEQRRPPASLDQAASQHFDNVIAILQEQTARAAEGREAA